MQYETFRAVYAWIILNRTTVIITKTFFMGSHIFHEISFILTLSCTGLIVSVFLLSFLDFAVSSSLDDSDSSVHSHFYHRDLR